MIWIQFLSCNHAPLEKMEINSHLVFAKLQAGHIPHWSNTTKTIGFYDTLTTSVLLNQCGIISSDNLVIIKLANKDSGLDICLWILETLLRWRWFGEHRCRWYNIIVTCLEQHSHNLWRLSCVCIVSASVSHLLKLMLWNRYSNIGEGFRRGVFEWNCGS